jgi:outer membrane protein assembly factor BamA
VDARHYFNFFPGLVFANRILIGLGYPYGNSYSLPNVKQFFSGGNSSLRGFRSRLVGPGTFNEQYLYGTNNYIETLGDMKVEGNSELRVKIYSFLNAAAFVDAGNIWLLRENPAFPGGKFTSDSYKELAADMGIGLRLDFKILLLRLDLGIPVRKPWLPDGERWVFNKIDFGDPSWRGQNMIFNIAIGYPF